MGLPLEAGAAREKPSGTNHVVFPRIVHRGHLLAVRARYTGHDFGSSGPYVAETFGLTPAYLCVAQLHDFPASDSWVDDRHFRMPRLAGRSANILDLRHDWRTDAHAPFDNVHLNVTQAALDACADELGCPHFDLNMPAALQPAPDATLFHLSMALLPALSRPSEMSGAFADHILTCATLHLLQTFGSLLPRAARFRGGLTPWQERKACEMLLDGTASENGLKEVAAACGLSTGHFIKAFRQTLGLPPHRWLLRQRTERARAMLVGGEERLDAIAAACGFADQSHLSRVFSRAYGVPPGIYRRAQRM